jgi:diguanylate cyclase (GGDEF)-like protein/PAS domain S-box-containing protein
MKMNKRASPSRAKDLRKRAEKAIKKKKKTSDPEGSSEDLLLLNHELEVHQIELEMQNEELRMTHAELEKSRSNYVDLYDYSPVGYFTLDPKGLILAANLTGAQLLQKEKALIINKPFSVFVHESDKDDFYRYCNAIVKTRRRQRIEISMKRKVGAEFYIQLESLPIVDSEGVVHQFRVAAVDVTERRKSENSFAMAKAEWERTFDTIPDLMVVIGNDSRIKSVNRALSSQLGIPREQIIGRKCYSVLHGSDAPPPYCQQGKFDSSDKEHIREIYEPRMSGHFMQSASPIYDDAGTKTGIVEVWRNINARKKMEEQIITASITDELTGLLNRRGFLTLSEQQCKIADRKKTHISMLFLDLDGMKGINDTLGHREGDLALKDMAQIITDTFRESDIIGRLGGDEFAVLLTEPSKLDIEGIMLNHINENIKTFNEQKTHKYELSVSLGCAISNPEDSCSIEDLLVLADSSMYENKKQKIKHEVMGLLNGEHVNRRIVERNEIKGNCRVEIQGSDPIKVKNISAGGICLENMDHLVTTKFHSMNVLSDNKRIPVKGIMVWSKLTGAEDYEAGLKFIALNERARHSLAEITSVSTH